LVLHIVIKMPGLIAVLVEISQNLKRNIELNERLIHLLEGDNNFTRCNNLFDEDTSYISADNEELKIQTLEETQALYEQMKFKEMEEEPQLSRENALTSIPDINDIVSQLNNPEVNEESENDLLMVRRAAYHKSQGTFQPTEDSKKRTLKAKLELLGSDEAGKLAFGILKEAKHNVQHLLSVDPLSPDFEERVEAEADRLLEVWSDMN
jgi:hypothetical protein